MEAAGRLATRLPAAASRLALRIDRVRPAYVLVVFIAVEWVATLALALTVRRNGWLYYQGGDQQWFYTTSWLLRHGQLTPTVVGYGWSILLMPLTLFGNANLLEVLPAIVLIDVLVLMPLAVLAMYGIGKRIGGRLFAYWVIVLWIAVPFIGIKYTDAGFHLRYTAAALPQGLGLTAMSDFPSMVMLVVAAYFVLRALQGGDRFDALFAGLVGGFSIGIKPSNSIFLIGAVLAFASARRLRPAATFAIGFAPSLLVLLLWKWRGLGYVPLFHSQGVVRLASGPAVVAGLHTYIHLNWAQLGRNLDSLQEHFWSARVVEWLVIAGVVGLARRSFTTVLLFGGWFFAFVLVKGTDTYGNLEDASLLRMLIPAIPAFILLLASLPLLLPGLPSRLDRQPLRPWGTPRLRSTLAIAAGLLFVVAPAALATTARPLLHSFSPDSRSLFWLRSAPVPLDPSLHFEAHRVAGGVRLTWRPQHLAGAHVTYQLIRVKLPRLGCQFPEASLLCVPPVLNLSGHSFFDNIDPPDYGRWEYRLLVVAGFTRSALDADTYVASLPAVIDVR